MGHNGLSGLHSPWIWAECKIPLQATARLIDSLLTCDQKRKTCVDVGLRFLKTLIQPSNGFQGKSQDVLKCGPRRAAVAPL